MYYKIGMVYKIGNGLYVCSSDNILTGGRNSEGVMQNSILELEVTTMTWTLVGSTIAVRSDPAVAVINLTNSNYKDYCVDNIVENPRE